jgi:hypothetical protein
MKAHGLGLAFCVCLLSTNAQAQTYTSYSDLHDFGGTVVNASGKSGLDGTMPQAEVTFDSAGNMYETASEGGPYNASLDGDGMIWEITNAGVYKDLHDFRGTVINANGKSGPDDANPYGGVSFDRGGNMYGVASGGGANGAGGEGDGMVWEITKAGVYKDLHDFGGTVINASGQSGPDGLQPDGVTVDPLGNLYGTAIEGRAQM